jgi:hypothetical protein
MVNPLQGSAELDASIFLGFYYIMHDVGIEDIS